MEFENRVVDAIKSGYEAEKKKKGEKVWFGVAEKRAMDATKSLVAILIVYNLFLYALEIAFI